MAEAELVVNATSVGMGGSGTAVSPTLLGPHQLIVDLVYHPVQTPLLVAARQQGARTLDGVGMLVHQAAAAFALWTGQEAPVAAMEVAARAALVGGR